MKIVKQFQLKNVIFTAVKNRCILHGHGFVMFSEFFCQSSESVSVNGAKKKHCTEKRHHDVKLTKLEKKSNHVIPKMHLQERFNHIKTC